MTIRIKYPRTYHLSYSPGAQSNDKVLQKKEEEKLTSLEVVVTEKLDGENTTIYHDHIHARSTNSSHHPSRAWVKSLQAQIGYKIPKDIRICGENLFAKHSILYKNLPTYFMVFNIWKEQQNIALSWEETVKFCNKYELIHVPVIYRGKCDFKLIHKLWEQKTSHRESEGYVVRYSGEIIYNDWSRLAAKYVRKNHVQTDEHWLTKHITQNLLKK